MDANPPTYRRANLALFLIARFLATTALHMQGVAVGWQVYDLTGDPFDLGLIGLAQFAPFVPLVLIAGHVADRRNRKRIIASCYLVEMLCALALAWLSLNGVEDVWQVLVVLAVHGATRAFMMPATQAILVDIAPGEAFARAVALSSSSFQLAVIVGPALGGGLYLAGPATVYGVVAGLLALSCALLGLARVHRPVCPPSSLSWHSLSEGVRFVVTRPAVFGAISLDLFAVLFGGATALLPAYARDVLGTGPSGLGLLRMAPAVGAALMAAVLVYRPLSRRLGRRMFDGVFLFGAATVVFALSRDFALSFVALVMIGTGDMLSVYVRHNLIQLSTPDAIRGRVSAVNAIFIGASNELGEFESGLSAAWLGLVPALLAGGVATLLIGMLWMHMFPALRRMDRLPHDLRSGKRP